VSTIEYYYLRGSSISSLLYYYFCWGSSLYIVILLEPGFLSYRNGKKNSKGNEVTVTGKISGSTLYKDGDEVTTSSIAAGEIKSGNVVQTTSGSKYYLN